VKELSLWKF